MHVDKETSIDLQAHGKSIDQEEQQTELLDDHFGHANRYLVGHMAEMHGKWPMAACYF